MYRRIERAATLFGNADFVHRQALEGLIERLSPVVMQPVQILDLGAGNGRSSRTLAKSFRKSRVISLDLSAAMLRIARAEKPFFSKLSELRGDAYQLPLREGSIDFVCANLLLPWIDDLPNCLGEIARVLKKGGVFAFATLGPDSFAEIRSAWSEVDSFAHIRVFPDMHDVGDALMKNGLSNPVLDVDHLTVTYQDTAALYRDLTATGARNCLQERQQSITGKSRFRHMENALHARGQDGVLPVTLELVYGHAWGSGPPLTAGEVHLDPGSITLRNRR